MKRREVKALLAAEMLRHRAEVDTLSQAHTLAIDQQREHYENRIGRLIADHNDCPRDPLDPSTWRRRSCG